MVPRDCTSCEVGCCAVALHILRLHLRLLLTSCAVWWRSVAPGAGVRRARIAYSLKTQPGTVPPDMVKMVPTAAAAAAASSASSASTSAATACACTVEGDRRLGLRLG